MSNQNLLIYQLPYLYEIMRELEDYLNYKVIETTSQKRLDEQIKLISNQTMGASILFVLAIPTLIF